jgi:hypothetical protein
MVAWPSAANAVVLRSGIAANYGAAIVAVRNCYSVVVGGSEELPSCGRFEVSLI